MAGGGAPTPSKGGKKAVDFVVNLVPTIDLLSVLISFLLITAVWVQLARINTDNVVNKATDRPKQSQNQAKPLKILLTANAVMVRFQGTNPVSVSMGDDMLTRLRGVLTEFKKKATEDQKVIVAAEDTVNYLVLIEVMDLCLDVGLSGLSVADPSTFGS
jgi:biopolymer transport protein ExbD